MMDPISRKLRQGQRRLNMEIYSAISSWYEADEAERKEWAWVKANRRRLRREYGNEGLDLIAKLVDKTYYYRPNMTEQQRWSWAEAKYARGEVLC